MKRACPALLTVAAVALLAPATSVAAGPCRLSAPTHHPKATKRWPVTVSCYTASGRALHATATYQFIAGGFTQTRYPSPNADPNSACSKAGTCRHSPYPFTGRMRDGTFTWPRRAIGIPIKFRVVVRVRHGGTYNLDYAVKVRR